jgi:hypothetical protein
MSAAGLSIEPALAPAADDVVHEAREGERCVFLDGGTAGGRARVSADALALHRRYVRAGCDVGVHLNVGYLTSDGWRVDAGAGLDRADLGAHRAPEQGGPTSSAAPKWRRPSRGSM